MEEYKITEKDAFEICRRYNLLSPYYELGIKRQGCWFCPNCSIKTFAQFQKDYPQLWNELKILSHDKEMVSPNFKYGMTFAQVEKQIMEINNQVNMFDLLEEEKE
jgi:3'-phosphoadenosine 5'-phosphosulfate sulfotransferase (PAPS reductase)/FAD synthetase